MRRSLRAHVAVLTLTVLAVVVPPQGARAEDAAALTRAWAAAGARDWAGAQDAARQSGPIAQDLVLWQQLRAGHGTWQDYRDFARRNADWPGLDLLHRQGEALLRPDLPPDEIIGWFGTRRPTTLTGETALLAALRATDPQAADAEAIRFWIETPLDRAELASFAAAQGELLAPHHADRLARLLDQGEWAAAELMLTPGIAAPPRRPPDRPSGPAGDPANAAGLGTGSGGGDVRTPTPPLVTEPAADLARARIALQAGRPGVDDLIKALPPALRDDAGLAMDRFTWRVAAKQTDAARALLLERSGSAEALRDPARWASFRVDHARAALRAGDWALAGRLAAAHFLPADHRDHADLEWLAGYAALRAGDPDRALGHFRHLQTVVGSTISTARALYWQGRAMQADGDADGARAAYARAARDQSAYYGQLAAERLGLPMDPALAVGGPAVDSLPDWRGSELRSSRVWQAALWLVAAGDPASAQRFLLHLAGTAPAEQIGGMARLMMELRRPWDALRLSKQATAKGVVFPAAHFPLTGLERSELGLPAELVLAIARQESEFNHSVSSHAGAKGLMQVMPETARAMARRIDEPFVQARLTTDAAYNARLGAAYLQGLRERFGASIALVAAGYNAGPGRSARWLRDFGDLRQPGPDGADPVDWVEMIPFDETRNYVMRVAEALPVYRARIAGRPAPIVPTWDLRGGLLPLPALSPLRLALSDRPPGRPIRVAAAPPGAALAIRMPWRGPAASGDEATPGQAVPGRPPADATTMRYPQGAAVDLSIALQRARPLMAGDRAPPAGTLSAAGQPSGRGSGPATR
ncbi:lytic transglycosylase domain-containing protein [uncultured Paracoccus sp.]|uniref:lytic transglycosylase domain-containing protein n=1 Tax=uncultured Paracoccus sp. TaxID=189685 RepID=UPI00262742D7|nr:lytic transglycosylase domain-containing protein [uncultured Paracoccus sp.]